MTQSPITEAGGHVGLYGGTLNQAVCDKNQLVTYLTQNPAKGAAWASVIGIQPSQIAPYVAGLTPVILRSDTFVTNHGYVNGRADAIPAVLQAGTAVLVDDKGEPVTKCYCGNPLSPPPYYTSTPPYYGPTWSYWHPGNVTVIQNNPTIINIFVLVDVRTGQTIYLQPGGTTPTATNPAAPTTTPTTLPTPPRPSRARPSRPADRCRVHIRKRSDRQAQAGLGSVLAIPPSIEQAATQDIATLPGSDPSFFVLQVTDHTTNGDTQVFTWNVDPTETGFTPTNALAQDASNNCPLFGQSAR